MDNVILESIRTGDIVVIDGFSEMGKGKEVDLSKGEKQSKIYSLFYSWFQELYAEHQIEGARDNLITLLERAANARLDEL